MSLIVDSSSGRQRQFNQDIPTTMVVSPPEDKPRRKESLIPEEYLLNNGRPHRPSFTIGTSESELEESDSSTSFSSEFNSFSHFPRMTSTSIAAVSKSHDNNNPSDSLVVGGGRTSPVPFTPKTSIEYQPKLGLISSGSYSRPSSPFNTSSGVPSSSSRRLPPDDDEEYIHDEEIHLIAKAGKSKGLTRRQWAIFGVFGIVEFFCAMVISLQAPFYPAEAESKGATASEYGFVFGVFDLTVFLISPVYGSQIHKIGPKLVFNLGILTTATCAVLFGFLDRIEDRTTFVALSIVTRIVEALGEAGFVTASFTIIACEFPSSVATTFATMETLYGVGLICGPMVGGFLYEIGGFSLPFIVVGGLLFSSAIVTHFILPKTRKVKGISEGPAGTDGNRVTSSGFNIFKVLRIPSIALAAFSIFTASASLGYLNATLEPHIRQFNLTPFVTGTLFIINGGCYALSAPVWGWLCDQLAQLKYITLTGSICIIFGFALIGPVPFIPMDTSLWGVIIGQVIQGIGLGAVLVSAFIQALRDAIKYGFPDDLMTYGVISSIWTSMFALGSFVGPTLSGILYDNVGFRIGTLFVLALQLIVITLVIIFIVSQNGSSSSSKSLSSTTLEEKDLLLLEDDSPFSRKKSSGAGQQILIIPPTPEKTPNKGTYGAI